MATVTIAHLTDVHLAPVVGLTLRTWGLKRALGYANWLRSRRRAHSRPLLDRLCADLLAQAPDHIAVTGDLTNLGLPRELSQAARWLAQLGAHDRVSAIPGNHDIYTNLGRDPGTARWIAFMGSDAASRQLAPPAWGFPYVRVVGSVALIGLNSAHPTPPFVAAGTVGAEQLARLALVLRALAERGLFRLVMIHHPPLPGQASPRRALSDAAALQAVLQEMGVELVIHGHNHRVSLNWVDGPSGPVPVVGGASASLAVAHGAETLGRYNLYRISGPPWRVEVTARGLAERDGDIATRDRFWLADGMTKAGG